MKFNERMMKHLKPLAKEFLEKEEYYLKNLQSDFHVRGMGDNPICWDNPDYHAINEVIDAEYRALTRKK
jgi:hypothetical protein